MTTRIGFLGMGIMGRPMARNLLGAGFDVAVWNRTPERCRELVEAGASQAESPRLLAEAKPGVICLCLTDTPDVEAVLFGPQGLYEGAQRGLIVIDHSTVSPVATRGFAERLAEKGVTLLDAPVSGGDTGAKAGTLSIMVGGPEDAFATVKPILEAMGKNIVRVGDVGAGQATKACNQIAVCLNLLGVCEAMALAKGSGVDLNKMLQVVSAGAGGSWQMTNLGPKIAAGDHDPGFMIDLVLKDLAIVHDTARAYGAPTPGTALVEALFRGVQAQSHGRLGTQALARALEALGGFRYADD